MHALIAVVTETRGDLEATLEPFHEENDDGWWDWWQLGGRATGFWASGYDPKTDPANIETCTLCAGTGTRPGGLEQFGREWFDGCNGCNGCRGTGKAVKWPTDWAPHPSNQITVGEFLSDPDLAAPYRVLIDSEVHETSEPDRPWVDALLADVDHAWFLSIVDYHY